MKKGVITPNPTRPESTIKSAMSVRIRPAAGRDFDRIIALLTSESLPTARIKDHLDSFFVVEVGSTIAGCIGLELYDDIALLRSAVVTPESRGTGLGSALVSHTIAFARNCGVRRLVLLTTTAESYFRKWGFRRIDQTTLSGPLTGSAEFTGACPASAVCMEVRL